ncbi:MAG: dihydrofolate reductase [Mycoplasma sp.]
MLKLIVCVDANNGIGKNNSLPWNIKAEMQHFKETTTNHTIVMGRKTFDSIGRVLPNRRNIIFSRNKNLEIDGAEVTDSIEFILDISKETDVFIIGGQEIYNLFSEYCDELIISRLKGIYDCDTSLTINYKFFEQIKKEQKEEFSIEYWKTIKNKILNGKMTSNIIKKELKNKLDNLVVKFATKPKLVIIQVGSDFASGIYIQNKIKLGKEIGINVEHIKLNEEIKENELIDKLESLNEDSAVTGILIQLPLPKTIDQDKIATYINPIKDVDCFNPINVGHIWTNPYSDLVNTLPCTPNGVIEILKYNNIEIASKDVVIVGRSNIVGKPLASLFLAENATVQICHSKTKNLKSKCEAADILVAAVGIPNFIKSDYIKKESVVIDVGINRDENNKLCGDVDFFDVISKVGMITPVPMGIGPMTLVMLMKNIIFCFEKQNS